MRAIIATLYPYTANRESNKITRNRLKLPQYTVTMGVNGTTSQMDKLGEVSTSDDSSATDK